MATGKEILLLLSPREQQELVRGLLKDYFKSRGIPHEEHNSHGLYYDVWVGGLMFMFDLSPEDEPRPYDPGTLVVRPAAHNYTVPRRLGRLGPLNVFDEGVFEKLDCLTMRRL